MSPRWSLGGALLGLTLAAVSGWLLLMAVADAYLKKRW